jgi:hypothetical protein
LGKVELGEGLYHLDVFGDFAEAAGLEEFGFKIAITTYDT